MNVALSTPPKPAKPADLPFAGGSASAVVRVHEQTVPADETILDWADLDRGEQRVRIKSSTVAVARNGGVDAHRLTFRVLTGRLQDVSLGLRLVFDAWSTRVHVMMPAAAYGANRYEPTGTWQSEVLEDRGPNPAIIQQPLVPRLDLGGGGSLQMKAGDMSVPAVALYFPDSNRGRGRGLILATPQRAAGVDLESVIRVCRRTRRRRCGCGGPCGGRASGRAPRRLPQLRPGAPPSAPAMWSH